jgi:hypothetical protein
MSDILATAAAREHLRLGDEVTDAELDPYILAAESVVADFLGRPLIGAGGWTSLEDLPANVVHAVKLVLTDLYDNRAAPLTDQVPLRALVGRYVLVSFG